MINNIGFFSSQYKDENSNVLSLGGGIYSRLVGSTKGEIFSPVNEYDSTNSSIDYRVIYIKNITNKQSLLVTSPTISVEHFYPNKREILNLQDLYRVRLNLFVPTYAYKNQDHDKIYSTGVFVSRNRSINEYIISNTNPRYYGRTVFLDFLSLGINDYFPVIVERIIKGPVPFINNFSFSLSAKYTVTTE